MMIEGSKLFMHSENTLHEYNRSLHTYICDFFDEYEIEMVCYDVENTIVYFP